MNLSLFIQAVLDPAIAKPAVEALLTVVVGVSTWLGKRGEHRTREVVTGAIAAHAASSETRFDALDEKIGDLKGIVIGPDGKNGMRGRQEEIRTDVKELVDALVDKSIADGRVDERVKTVEKKVDGIEHRERAR